MRNEKQMRKKYVQYHLVPILCGQDDTPELSPSQHEILTNSPASLILLNT